MLHNCPINDDSRPDDHTAVQTPERATWRDAASDWVLHFMGYLAGVDTRRPYWWMTDDKRAILMDLSI